MGKGSAPRPKAVNRQTFSDNWDNVFTKRQLKVKKVEDLTPEDLEGKTEEEIERLKNLGWGDF